MSLQQPQPDALYAAGLASLQGQNFAEAEASFREVYRLEPENIRGLAGVAQVYAAQARYGDALSLLRGESQAHPRRADIRIAAGNIDLLARQPEDALADFHAALGLLEPTSKDYPMVLSRIGEAYRIKGDPNASVEALRKAAQLAPTDITVLTKLAVVLDSAGDRKNALAQYRAALDLNPDNPIAANNLAFLIAESGGDLYEALALARSARKIAPQLLEITDTIGWVSLKLGWVDEALDNFESAVVKDAANPSFRSHLLAAIERKRSPSPTLVELKKALKAAPTPENQQKIRDLLPAPGTP